MSISINLKPEEQGVGGVERACGALSIAVCTDQVITPWFTGGHTLQEVLGTPQGAQAYIVAAEQTILIGTGMFYGGVKRLFAPRIQSTPAQVEVPKLEQKPVVETPQEIKPDPTRTYGAEQRSRGLYENQTRAVGERSRRFETQRRVNSEGGRLHEDQPNVVKDVPAGNYKIN